MGNQESKPELKSETRASSTAITTTNQSKMWNRSLLKDNLWKPVVSLFVDLPYFLFTLVTYETLLTQEEAELTEKRDAQNKEGWKDILAVLKDERTPGIEEAFSREHVQHVHEKPCKAPRTMEEPLHNAWRKVPFLNLDYTTGITEKTTPTQTKTTAKNSDVHRGRVIWFDRKRGYGFIHPLHEDLQKIYVHHTALQGKGYHYLFKGEQVEYQERVDKQGRPKAVKVTGPKGGPLKIAKLRTRHDHQAKQSNLEPLPTWHTVPQFYGLDDNQPKSSLESDPNCVIAVHDETHETID